MTATALLKPTRPSSAWDRQGDERDTEKRRAHPMSQPWGKFKVNGSKNSIHRQSAKGQKPPDRVTGLPCSVTGTAQQVGGSGEESNEPSGTKLDVKRQR